MKYFQKPSSNKEGSFRRSHTHEAESISQPRGNKIYYSDCESLKVLLSTIKVDSEDGERGGGRDKSERKIKYWYLRERRLGGVREEGGGLSSESLRETERERDRAEIPHYWE